MIVHPAGLGPPCAQLLGNKSVGFLREVATRIEAPAHAGKTELIASIATVLMSPAAVRELIAGGPAGTGELAARLAGSVEAGFRGYVSPGVLDTDATVYGYLARRALVVERGYGEFAMPAEVAMALRGGRIFPVLDLDEPPLEPAKSGGADPEETALAAARRIVAELGELADTFAATPPKLLKAGVLGVREVRRAAKLLERSERDTARLIELFAGAGLIWVDDAEDVAVPTETYDAWLATDTAHRWSALAEAWLEAPVPFSIAGARSAEDKTIPPLPPGHDERASARRRAVLGVLRGLSAR